MTAQEHVAALAEMELLAHKDPLLGTPYATRLYELALRVEAYEKEHFPIPKPTQEEAAAFRKEQEEG